MRHRVGGESAEEGITPDFSLSVAGQGAEPRGGLAGDQFGWRGRPARAKGAGFLLECSGPAPAWGAWLGAGLAGRG